MITKGWAALDQAAARIMAKPCHLYEDHCWFVNWVNDVPHPRKIYNPTSNMEWAGELLDLLATGTDGVTISRHGEGYRLTTKHHSFYGGSIPFVITYATIWHANEGVLKELPPLTQNSRYGGFDSEQKLSDLA